MKKKQYSEIKVELLKFSTGDILVVSTEVHGNDNTVDDVFDL